MFRGPSGWDARRGRDGLLVFSLAARVHVQLEWEGLCFDFYFFFYALGLKKSVYIKYMDSCL